MKSSIEGPKDPLFLVRRKKQDEEDESDFEYWERDDVVENKYKRQEMDMDGLGDGDDEKSKGEDGSISPGEI